MPTPSGWTCDQTQAIRDESKVVWPLFTESFHVLINRAHTSTDINLPLDEQEKRWFDAIDGERTIGELAEPPDTRLRPFFERLWWHDHVVFDASRPRHIART